MLLRQCVCILVAKTMTTKSIRTYKELSRLKTFEERYRYLRTAQMVGDPTFDNSRWLNQKFYRSVEWKRIRNAIIIRDNGCDLGMPDRPILKPRRIYIHHMNPLTIDDIENMSELVTNPEYMICCSYETHEAIHFGSEESLPEEYKPRTANDTCPWK